MAYVLEPIIEGGAKIVQLRQKNSTKKELYELAIIYRNITGKSGVKMNI
jgi:thiamine monophosphate synthase